MWRTSSPETRRRPSAVAIVQPIGTPFPIPFADVMMSGLTSQCSMPNHLSPVRPQPVCTSSAINSPPCWRVISSTRSKYPAGGTINPPTPKNRFSHKRGDFAGRRRFDHFFNIFGARQTAVFRRQAQTGSDNNTARGRGRFRQPAREAVATSNVRRSKAPSRFCPNNCAAERRFRVCRSPILPP